MNSELLKTRKTMEDKKWHHLRTANGREAYVLSTPTEAAKTANLYGAVCQKVSEEVSEMLNRLSPKGYVVVVTDRISF